MRITWIRIHLCFVLCSYTFFLEAQVIFERIYEDYDFGLDIKATYSGDYLLLCEYFDEQDYNHIKIALLKVNETGNLIWEKKFKSRNLGRSLHVTHNQDIIIYSLNITLLDSSGFVKWSLDPSEELDNFSGSWFTNIFENQQDTSFVFVSVSGDFLKLDKNGNILDYQVKTSANDPWINDVYRDQNNSYWQVGYVKTQIGPASYRISGVYVAKYDSCYTLESDTVFEGVQNAVAVNQGINDDIIVLVDSLDRAKIFHLNEVGEIKKMIVHIGLGFSNTICQIEQLDHERYLLFGHSVKIVNSYKVIDQSISTGKQMIHKDNVYYFIDNVCPDCDDYYPVTYAGISKEVIGFPLSDRTRFPRSREFQINPNPI